MRALTPRPESTAYPLPPALMAQAATVADHAGIDGARDLASAIERLPRELYGAEVD